MADTRGRSSTLSSRVRAASTVVDEGSGDTVASPTTPKETCAVNVVARFRPMNDHEKETAAADGGPPFECHPNGAVEDKRRGQMYRRFDTLFDMHATQRSVYESTAKDMVKEVSMPQYSVVVNHSPAGCRWVGASAQNSHQLPSPLRALLCAYSS